MNSGGEGSRRDERVVPAYAFTRGRTHHAGPVLPIETVVTRDGGARPDRTLQAESLTIMRLCTTQPLSIAEIGALLQVPVGVARVLVGDLVSAGLLIAHAPTPAMSDEGPSQAVLGRLLDGLRAR